MSSNAIRPLTLEIAHVLFIDIVGYSKLLTDQQTISLQQLQDVVRNSDEFRLGQTNKQLISLPTGDGMALVFFGDPVAPVRCAIEISLALQSNLQFKLRMGVHSGPVYRIEDINASINVAGGGINLAQRVMDCGDAGHILLSKRIADDLCQLSDWAPTLHDLGEVTVKHGVKVHVFNLHTDKVGNSEVPMKFRPSVPSHTASSVPEPMKLGITDNSPKTSLELTKKHVVLLYKRNAQNDEHVLKLLQSELEPHGYTVFFDQHLTFSVESAREIERQIRRADVVIPLLSADSTSSEMFIYEVQLAYEVQQQNGKPVLLPVNVNNGRQLPSQFTRIFEPMTPAWWGDPSDDEGLVERVLFSLRGQPTVGPMLQKQKLDSVGGAVPLDSRFYIVREADEEFFSALMRHDSVVLVKGARQIGKTSLLARGLERARQAGAKVVLTDFQTLSAADMKSPDTLFLTLGELIADQLDLQVSPDQVWSPRRGPNRNFQWYLQREVLAKISGPLVWGIDEIDRLFTCDYGSQVFGLFRSWHNARALDPQGPWRLLTLAIAYATEAHLFITNLDQSPFNVGTRLKLEDFNIEQVAELNKRFGSPLKGEQDINRFFRLLNGHPYLVSKALHEMVIHDMSLVAFETVADRDEGPLADHLRRILIVLAQDNKLCDALREILRGRPCPTPDNFFRLRSAGIVAGDSPRAARLRCDLYRTYLQHQLL
ncbi:MAG TPA: AAA-like domain-containing protein [Pyrinomonadaceae bacterium]|nr:AAA-like domain-containing protein [Pyrinomonadaceae bacterium]